jgi:3-oxoacyl-[acyl-carrier protein] reductase
VTGEQATATSLPRVALVTGGSRGIGKACVIRLAHDGWGVVLTFVSQAGEADRVVEQVESTGGQAVAAQADVADGRAMTAVFDVAAERFGGLDAVVNAAGRMPLAPVVDLDLDELDSTCRTNLRGTFVVDQLAAGRLRAGGAIVNFSSSVVAAAFPTYAAYAASKGAVEVLTRVLAKELGSRDISVNAVAPGPTATDLFLRGKSQEQIDRLRSGIPLGRLGEPDDVANVVAFLVGPEGHWVNGQVVRVNGGMV